MTQHHFQTIEDAKSYTFAGNATITLQSLRSGTHFTYKVKLADENKSGLNLTTPMWFVNLLADGSADDGTFRYLGIVRNGEFRLTKASRAGADAPSVKAFGFFMSLRELHPQLVVRHEGRCGKCGRTLTVPESIDRGIGPECASKMGLN